VQDDLPDGPTNYITTPSGTVLPDGPRRLSIRITDFLKKVEEEFRLIDCTLQDFSC